jgi:hypothetical protein
MPEKKKATVRVREATRKDIPKLIELNRTWPAGLQLLPTCLQLFSSTFHTERNQT